MSLVNDFLEKGEIRIFGDGKLAAIVGKEAQEQENDRDANDAGQLVQQQAVASKLGAER